MNDRLAGPEPVTDPHRRLLQLKADRTELMDRVQAIDDEAATLVTELTEKQAQATKDWGHVVAAPPVLRSEPTPHAFRNSRVTGGGCETCGLLPSNTAHQTPQPIRTPRGPFRG